MLAGGAGAGGAGALGAGVGTIVTCAGVASVVMVVVFVMGVSVVDVVDVVVMDDSGMPAMRAMGVRMSVSGNVSGSHRVSMACLRMVCWVVV